MAAGETSGILVGVELGGTKMVVVSSRDGRSIDEREQFPTGEPDQTLALIRRSIHSVARGRSISAIGLASFGPIDLRMGSQTYGQLTNTPKPGWSGVDVVGGIIGDSNVLYGIDTDVNGAVMAEKLHGAGSASDHVAYLTVGTGVGGGIWSNGRVLHGSNHPEIGHVRVPRHPDDQHQSSCPFHKDCLEGMASGTAIRQRWGTPAQDLGHLSEPATRLEAWYLAHGIASLCAVLPVDTVVIGGGVSKLPDLHGEVSRALAEASGQYPPIPFAAGGPDVVAPVLGDDAGPQGAIEIALLALEGAAG